MVKILPFAAAGSVEAEHSMLSAAEIWTEVAIMQELNQLRSGAPVCPGPACCLQVGALRPIQGTVCWSLCGNDMTAAAALIHGRGRAVEWRARSHSPCPWATCCCCAGEQNATTGFIHLESSLVCREPYARRLVREWHAWDEAHGSENQPVDDYDDAGQLFALLITAEGGRDLEHFVVREHTEARSILFQARARSAAPGQGALRWEPPGHTKWRSCSCAVIPPAAGQPLHRVEAAAGRRLSQLCAQTALALAAAEEALSFEHRDLHIGNLLLRRVPGDTLCRARLRCASLLMCVAACRLHPSLLVHAVRFLRELTSCACRGVPVEVRTQGVQVTLIDFTLARVSTGSGATHSCDLEADPALFAGRRGDCQVGAQVLEAAESPGAAASARCCAPGATRWR